MKTTGRLLLLTLIAFSFTITASAAAFVVGTANDTGPWDLSGAIRDLNGRPIKNVKVTLAGGSLPQPASVYTGMSGQYAFTGLPGDSYTVTVSAKHFTFAPGFIAVELGSDINDADFTADSGFGVTPAGVKKVKVSDRPLKIPVVDPCPSTTTSICRRYVLIGGW